nr:hypothetical protein [Sphingomonas sp.]
MKPYVIGAIVIWFLCGIVGAWMLGQQRVDLRTIAGGSVTVFEAFNAPIE